MAGKGKASKGKKKLKNRKQENTRQNEKADGFIGNKAAKVQDENLVNNEELGTRESQNGNNRKSEKSDVLGKDVYELLYGIKLTSSDHPKHIPMYSAAKIPTHSLSAEESAFLKSLAEQRLANTPVHTPECGHPNLPRDIDDCGGSYELIELNCEKLLDCYKEDETGYPYIIKKAFKYIKEHNVSKDAFYPSIAGSNVKLHKISEGVEALRISGFQMVDHKDEAALLTAVSKGPIIGGVKESPEFTMLGNIVVDGKYCNHALMVMGYATDKKTGTNYWMVQNSMGSRWGNKGEGKVARDSSLPKRRKHLLTTTMYPTFE